MNSQRRLASLFDFHVESLESRRLLAGDVRIVDHAADDVSLNESSGDVPALISTQREGNGTASSIGNDRSETVGNNKKID